MRKLMGVAVGLGLWTACSDVKSDSVLTNGIYASLAATADGSGQTTTSAVLRVGGGNSTTFVELTDDDTLTAQADDGEPKKLQDTELFDYHGYSAILNGDNPATVFKIALTRSVDDGAPSSTMQLPEPFELIEPPTTVARDEELILTWTGAENADAMTLNVNGSCFEAFYAALVPDAGQYTLPANSLGVNEGQENESCVATFSWVAERNGELDSGYGEGGSAIGRQQRSFTASSIPMSVEKD